ncbi:Endonuclease III-like protein [Venustampulla echinocandica]|uniref:Endonuclease III homolog n=1 Tax=Venustampulla echinocandica TaxID=2656787 RepID=A0A370TUL1_9HELO|nr:Endonuclease III-like protein [Venustampulla echinocandica]RDL39217.1 Endonuclease III-like protein [Venustampulla echinocandica]
MRTSRISQETSRIINATSASPQTRRSTRSSVAKYSHSPATRNDPPSAGAQDVSDIEDAIPSRKRKRETPRTPLKQFPCNTTTAVKTETEQSSLAPSKDRKIRKPARHVKNEETGEVEIHPPNDWAEVYAVVKEMRLTGVARNAAVDTMGCERLAEKGIDPKIKRYQTLTALMLSSQTKDTTNALAMARLQKELPAHKEGAPVGLNLENILSVDPKLLNELIWAVGFHNNKTKYIKAAAEILRDHWNGDIPDTIEGLMSLPGVGPKMAYLCMSGAWGRTEGIGVDVHVHRITNLWGWNKTKGPEDTRLALQEWLPKELWHEINWLLVGFGQAVCLAVGRKCGDCELGLKGLCKSADRSKVAVGRKMREEKIKKDEEGNVIEKKETVKVEEVTIDFPINAAPDFEVPVEGTSEPPVCKELVKEEETADMEDIPNIPDHQVKKPTRRSRT